LGGGAKLKPGTPEHLGVNLKFHRRCSFMSIRSKLVVGAALVSALAFLLLWGYSGSSVTPSKPLKVLILTDMEGVDGIFNEDLECVPDKSPRWEQSRKLLTGEINAAAEGLFIGGATDVVVWDGHWSGENLSSLDIHPKVSLFTGAGHGFEMDPSYAAMIFIGQHAMAGADRAVLSHTESPEGVQGYWVNGKAVGEAGLETMHAGSFGIPVIMLAGDKAACDEIRDLIPQVEVAEVKWGVTRTSGFTLSHPAACALIRERARHALERLSEFKPYRVTTPVELKMEFAPLGTTFRELPVSLHDCG
jgi:D-amino peptidase